MPVIRIAPDLEMNYLVDDYTDPWRKPETILLLHGNHESSAVWFGWAPHLARQYRVLRPDMRGFGDSTAMPRNYQWSLDDIVEDFVALMQTLDISRVHLVGAKISSTIARRFAARHPERVHTLTVIAAPPPYYPTAHLSERIAEYEKQSGASWVRRTMSVRLGKRFPPEGVEWWVRLMERTPASTVIGFISAFSSWDISSDLPRITCPTLVITTEGSALSSVEETRAWQQRISHSKLLVLPGDSYHVAATDSDSCARATFDFISRVGTID